MAEITCELTDAADAKLDRIAKARGVPKSAVARDLIEKQLDVQPAPLAKARLEITEDGLPVIRGEGPPITAELVKKLLADFP